jgi:hypothetical protein
MNAFPLSANTVRVVETLFLPAYATTPIVSTGGRFPAGTIDWQTLTAGSPGAFPTVDGVTLNVGDLLLLVAAFNSLDNQIYQLTNPGSASSPWVLTSLAWQYSAANGVSTSFANAFYPAGMKVAVTAGTTYGGSNWQLQGAVGTPLYPGVAKLNWSQV